MDIVLYEVKERIGYLTSNRPEKRNALNYELVAALKEAFTKAENDPGVKGGSAKSQWRSFLCRSGPCLPAAIAAICSLEENLADSHHLKELFLKIYQLKKVVLLQVPRTRVGRGCGLATVCDFVFAVPEAKFGYTEVKIGFIPALVLVFLRPENRRETSPALLLSGELVAGQRSNEFWVDQSPGVRKVN